MITQNLRYIFGWVSATLIIWAACFKRFSDFYFRSPWGATAHPSHVFNSCIQITVFFTRLDFIHIIQFNCWKLWCMTQLMLCKNPWNSTMIFLLVLFFHKRNLCFCAICYHYGGVSITVLLLLAFQLSELLQ